MDLYLDSANIHEAEEAIELGIIKGITTTPTFMHEEGVENFEETILKLSKMTPHLHIEILKTTSEEIYAEANRLIDLGLNKNETVFKLPISNEGLKACKKLTDESFLVNLHLVYTIQQAYVAMLANTTYICPLVGRLQDQGHDALSLVKECVEMVNHAQSETRIMFSSVRNPEHIRNAIQLGVHACTAPWQIIKQLSNNYLTETGFKQFQKYNALLNFKAKDLVKLNEHMHLNQENKISDALIKMTENGLGIVIIMNQEQKIVGTFTDGDLRRILKDNKEGILEKQLSNLKYKDPICVNGEESIERVIKAFRASEVDNIIVIDELKNFLGIIDIQDIIQMNLY